jgi:hypothetical protein
MEVRDGWLKREIDVIRTPLNSKSSCLMTARRLEEVGSSGVLTNAGHFPGGRFGHLLI